MKAVPTHLPTGLMFHHFHGDGPTTSHVLGQGTISTEIFDSILTKMKDRLLGAEEWLHRFKRNELEPHHTCLTFDDALLCQYDIAGPVMEAHGITGFWFVYTSMFEGTLEKLEIFRHFRTVSFPDIDDFYQNFFSMLEAEDLELFLYEKERFRPHEYLSAFPFYTESDRFFRYLRDCVLGVEKYERLMLKMMSAANYRPEEQAQKLWLTSTQLASLADAGHIIGLHSHTHPTTLKKLTPVQQREEYEANFSSIERLIGIRPQTVSHPCNSYGSETLEILSDLGVVMGFRADMVPVADRSGLELPRQDSANLIGELVNAALEHTGNKHAQS